MALEEMREKSKKTQKSRFWGLHAIMDA